MKQALVVGIDNYPGKMQLEGCANDATRLAEVLDENDDNSKNFIVKREVNVCTKSRLRQLIINLFNRDADIALFYFSGHGYVGESGSYIVTPDFYPGDEGVSMDEILRYANESDIKNKIIILDCCHSGAFGAPASMKGMTSLRKGITILTASRDNEAAFEVNGLGIFTGLLIEALKGGAADLKGDITPGSVYAYIDQAIGEWGQRPVFKANITRFTVLRKAKPPVPPDILKQICNLFPVTGFEFQLDETHEDVNTEIALPENVAKYKLLQRLNRVGLVIPSNPNNHDMYWAAMNKECCKLTEFGKHYWRLVKDGMV